MIQEQLFSKGVLSRYLLGLSHQAKEYVAKIPQDQFLNTPEDDLVEHCFQFARIEPLTIYKDRMVQEPSETKVDVSDDPTRPTCGHGPCYVAGISILITIPFTGDPYFWKLTPDAISFSPRPQGQYYPDSRSMAGYLEIEYSVPIDKEREKIKHLIEDNFHRLDTFLQAHTVQIDQYNSALPGLLRQEIQARRNHLQQNAGIARFVGIPIKSKPGTSEVAPLALTKKIVIPLPPPPSAGYKPEPGITDGVYESILKVIRHICRTWETTPRPYAVHPEEELRDILLGHLNGHFQGAASGETFRKSGKTDIRIEDQNRAAFVAECKIWEGSKKLNDGIDQILGYLTWRDCKTAILIFNRRNANFSDLFLKIPEVFNAHPRHIKESSIATHEGEWRYIFRSKDDDARLVHIHVFAFNLYVADKQ